METFDAGTLAGAGAFRCDNCGFAIALHERDVIPACPHCHGGRLRRSSIFEGHDEPATFSGPEVEQPEWLPEVRAALEDAGDYLAFEDDDRVRVAPLEHGWTRIGRSMAAQLRFDDPTVSRRHALLHRQEEGCRILDDRSLNGVFLNGERVEWAEVADGDEIVIGRFRLYFLSSAGGDAPEARETLGSTVG